MLLEENNEHFEFEIRWTMEPEYFSPVNSNEKLIFKETQLFIDKDVLRGVNRSNATDSTVL